MVLSTSRSSSNYWLLDSLRYMPMASAQDVSYAFGKDVSAVYRALRALEDDGVVSSQMMSCNRRRQKRWWLNGVDDSGNPGFVSFAHASMGATRMMDNPVASEWFYFLASTLSVSEQGKRIGRRMLEFCWFKDRVFDAAARYTDGWVAFFWSGYWHDKGDLEKRFERLGRSLVNPYGGRARPSLYCFVVPDWWQAHLVVETAKMFGLDESLYVAILERSDDDIGVLELVDESRDWVLRGQESEVEGVTPFNAAVSTGLFGEEDGAWLIRLLWLVEQWPASTKKTLGKLSRQSSGRVKSGVDRLVGRGLLRQRDNRYTVERVGLAGAARRDRVWNGRPGRHFSISKIENLYDGRLRQHEQGLLRVMRGFAEANCSVASGWRAYDVMGSSGQIAPDGVVMMNDGPFGPGWHYVEYELRARGEKLVDAKLRGYYSKVRANDFPVMIVCRPETEEMFRRKGEGLPMMVTTVPEIRRGSLTSDGSVDTVWRVNGDPVRVLW